MYALPEGAFSNDPELLTKFLWAVKEYRDETMQDNMRELMKTLQID